MAWDKPCPILLLMEFPGLIVRGEPRVTRLPAAKV